MSAALGEPAVTVSTHLPARVLTMIDDFAQAKGWTRSHAIREIIGDWASARQPKTGERK